MADYIYLLENRLSGAQQRAILAVREIARAKGLTVFLVGGAVRDLTSGSPVRDLDVAVQGNALKLKKDIEKAGGVITGEHEAGQSVFVRFPGSVRMEIGSTLTVNYPKPGKAVVHAATILEDLRRRDFTANAMALSLNEGSYGLLMDPLNGVADIENRELRLVSNYGFIEDPVRMIRAARYAARLGWQLEAKTQQRYETGKAEAYIEAMHGFARGYETEEIVHEEDPLRVLRRLETEGWMKHLAPTWGPDKVDVTDLEKLRDTQMQLQMQGIHPDPSAAQFPLLTAKLNSKELAELKKSFPRQGFVAEIEALEGEAKKFAAELGSKQAASPSAAWKMIAAAQPEVVLWVAYSTKSAALQAKFNSFYTEWPQARQKVPYTLMQEMRIVPDLLGYVELVEKLVFELMDGKLGTVEEMKAFLEPYSPPAPPPPVSLRRPRAAKKDAKAKRKKTAALEPDAETAEPVEADELELPDVEIDLDSDDAALELEDDTESDDEVSEPSAGKPARPSAVRETAKSVASKASTKSSPKAVSSIKAAPAKAPLKIAANKAVVPTKVAGVKQPVKSMPKSGATKSAPSKKVLARPVAKKVLAKPLAAKKVDKVAAKFSVAPKAAAKKTPGKLLGKTVTKKVSSKPAKVAAKAIAKLPPKGNPKKAMKVVAKVAPKGKAGKPPAKVASKNKKKR